MIKRKVAAVAGITLIELMMVVAILAVVLTLAAPSFTELFVRNRLDTATNELMTAFSFARSEALRRGVPVSVRRVSQTAGDWSQGWQIFVDPNRNGSLDPGEELLREGGALPSPLTLRTSPYDLPTFVPFTADGRVGMVLDDGVSALGARAIFVFCHGDVLREGSRSRSRVVVLNTPGRVRTGVDADNNGIPEAFGADIASCAP